MHALRRLVTELDLRPRDALTWFGVSAGDAIEVGVELALMPGLRSFSLALTLTPAPAHADLFLTPRELWLRHADELTRTGDTRFDEAFALRCQPTLLALFDHERRRLLESILETHALIVDAGRVRLFAGADDPGLAERVADALAVARHLGRTELGPSLAQLLADPDPGVRGQLEALAMTDEALRVLVNAAREGLTVDTPRLSHAALLAQATDRSLPIELRVQALVAMLRDHPWSETAHALPRLEALFAELGPTGPEGLYADLLKETLPLWLDSAKDPEAAFSLLSALWSHRPRPRVGPALGSAFARILRGLARPETATWAAELAHTSDPGQLDQALLALDATPGGTAALRATLDPTLRAMLVERAPEVARTHRRGAAFLEIAASSLPPAAHERLCHIIVLMGELGDPVGVAFLVSQLEHGEEAVREAALTALGRCALPAHIPYLEPQTSGLFRAARLKQRAREAITAIRRRHGIADAPGGLSLSDGSPGSLSLPDE